MILFPQFHALEPSALNGKVVLIVGATGGLGSALARECGRLGSTVILLGRKVPTLQRLYDTLVQNGAPQPAIYPLNLEGAGPADYDQMADAIAQQFSQLDAIFFVSAHFKGLSPLDLTQAEEWIRGLHINLGALQFIVQSCLPIMRRQTSSQIIFAINDSEQSSGANWGAYGVAQVALTSYIRILASELEHSTVKVFGVQPGPMRTALRSNAYFAENPGELISPDEIAPAFAWLLSENCPRFSDPLLDARHIGSSSQ